MRINSYKLDFSSEHGYFTSIATENVQSNAEEEKVKITSKERESLEISAVGSVKTEQSTIHFNLNDSALFESSITIETIRKKQNMVDPLVISLGGGLAKIDAKEKFGFDIDANGIKDKISLLADGSGFLALDKNGDQIINDGSELFGAKTGDGFAELASYDSTKDGVIDENDDIFSKLKIWIKTSGTDKLLSLKEAKVGALLIDNVSSEFSIRGSDGVNAKIQRSGVALMENGQAGWMSHIDFAVEQENETNETENTKTKISIDANKNITHKATGTKTKTTETATETMTELKQKLKELEGKLRSATDEDTRKLLSLEKTRISEQIATLERLQSKISA